MIPVPTLVAELVAGVGAALAGANIVVLLRPWWVRRRTGKIAPRPASTRRVVANIVIGLLVMTWGIATLVHGTSG
ncbi:MAG TPA: hypothetical protein VGH10_00745 [Actinomycetota bacterium]|jgi:hypothetical protein